MGISFSKCKSKSSTVAVNPQTDTLNHSYVETVVSGTPLHQAVMDNIYVTCMSYSPHMLKLQNEGFRVMEWNGESVKLYKSRESYTTSHRFAKVQHVWWNMAKITLGKINVETETLITRDVVSIDNKNMHLYSITLDLSGGIEKYFGNGNKIIITYYNTSGN